MTLHGKCLAFFFENSSDSGLSMCVAGCDSGRVINQLEDLLETMPGDDAPEEEINDFVEKVLAAPGGAELIREFAGKLAEGGELDEILKAEAAEREELTLRSARRFVFRIELVGTTPLVWRRVSLPADCSYFHLHCAIQDAFGWDDSHLHRFEVWEDGERELTFSLGRDDEADEGYGEVENKVMALFLEEISEFLYRYDFGDDWQHQVVVEGVFEAGSGGTSTELVPKLHAGERHAPPENCGGIHGFTQFLQGNHPLCEEFEPETLEEFRSGQPDLSQVVFREAREAIRFPRSKM